MDKIDIILWVMSGGFGLMLVMWHGLNNRMDKLDDRMDKIESRIDKVGDDVKDIDRRLCRIEGSMASKDCCMLKDDRQLKKAE